MDEENFDEFLRGLIGEQNTEEDPVEKSARGISHFMYAYYSNFLLRGFDHQTALNLTIYVAEKLIFQGIGHGKS